MVEEGHLTEFGEEGFDLGLKFRDAIRVRLDGFGGLVGHADEILVRHLFVAEDGATVLAGDGKAVVGAGPDEAVVVGVG